MIATCTKYCLVISVQKISGKLHGRHQIAGEKFADFRARRYAFTSAQQEAREMVEK
jgi:hypothetical protein